MKIGGSDARCAPVQFRRLVPAVPVERDDRAQPIWQATFTSLQTFLTGTTSSFLYSPAPTEMNWRSLFGALYAQDVIRLALKFTLSLGFRGEFSTGWNEAHGRAANYTFTTESSPASRA